MRRVLQKCAELSLGLVLFAKASVVLVVPLLLLSELYFGRASTREFEYSYTGLVFLAVIIYFVFCWFLPDDSLVREKIRAEREIRDAAFINAIQQPGYWGKESRDSVLDRKALLASLKAQGYEPAHVMTMARFVAKRKVMRELQSQGISSNQVEVSYLSAATKAMLDSRTEELIEEAKRMLDKK